MYSDFPGNGAKWDKKQQKSNFLHGCENFTQSMDANLEILLFNFFHFFLVPAIALFQ